MAKKSSTENKRPNRFRGFMDFMSEASRARSEFMLQHSGEPAVAGGLSTSAYVPTVDIYAEGKDLFIRCEVPGVRQGDISVSLTNGVLSIFGERQSELNEDKVTYYTRERSYGQFRRDMLLPDVINSSDITANTRNGLLEIVIRGGASARIDEVTVTHEPDN